MPIRKILLLFLLPLAVFHFLPEAPAADGALHFAILPDRTGGMRAGVFEKAVDKINALQPQPEFVISIGDLIDGYTQTPAVWEKQWDEIDAVIKKIKAPFYAVVGNHDISNAKMRPAWTQRRGAAHYAFVRKNALFLILDSEELNGGGFSETQINFALKTLAENSSVRWTFVFFHRPFWLDKNQCGFEKIAPALAGRNHTVFTGHLHHYIKGARNGMAYYVLATAGGDSALRGEAVGEFDHITTVTLPECGAPQVVNLALDSDRIIPDDVLTEENEPRAAALRDGTWLDIAPIVLDSEKIERLEVPVTLRNPAATPLRVTGTLPPQNGLCFTPDVIETTVPAGETKTLTLGASTLRSAPFNLHALNEAGLAVTLTAACAMPSGTISLPASRPVLIDWIHTAPRAPAPVAMQIRDGKLDAAAWPDSLFTTVTRPMYIKESWDWHGPADGTFRFAVQQRDGMLYVAVETTDDVLVANPDPAALQDKIIVTIQTTAGATALEAICGSATKNLMTVARPKRTGMASLFAISLPAGEEKIRLNVGWVDVDQPENTKPSILWWMPPAETAFGWFDIKK